MARVECVSPIFTIFHYEMFTLLYYNRGVLVGEFGGSIVASCETLVVGCEAVDAVNKNNEKSDMTTRKIVSFCFLKMLSPSIQ